MACSPSFPRTVVAGGLLAAAAMASAMLPAQAGVAQHAENDAAAAPVGHDEQEQPLRRASSRVLPDIPFTTAADATRFREMAASARRSPVPNARAVASAFIREQLGIDGEDYVVAHFATPDERTQGKPDHTLSLTVALMEAFPDSSRHSVFAGLSDMVGGLNAGGQESPGVVSFSEGVFHSANAKQFFTKVGMFLWSRSGPGYVYNTFFARGSVIETVHEDKRSLDEAFGIYRAGGFVGEYVSPFLLSEVVRKFSERGLFDQLPYVERLNRELDRYWEDNRSSWPVLARYLFVQEARNARDSGLLTPDRYRQVMREGAPRVPLDGAIALDSLRNGSILGSSRSKRFDINGYAASNLVRFIAADGGEVMYVPGGEPAFVVAGSERELGLWVLEQAKDPGKLENLLSHFSIYNSQDSTFWTGVKLGLENIASGRWATDSGAVDHASTVIEDDIFEDMRTQTESRLREDAGMQSRTAWDAWRTTINRTATVLAPLGYLPVLAIPVQVGTGVVGLGLGIDQGVNGRTAEDRKAGLEQVATTVVTNVPLGAIFGGRMTGGAKDGAVAEAEGNRASFLPPQRINGRIGYPLGPTKPPGWPLGQPNRLYRRPDGGLSRWIAGDEARHRTPLPENARQMPDGTFVLGSDIYGRWRAPGTSSAIRLVADGAAYRIVLDDGNPGPLVEKTGSDTWDLAFTEGNYAKGSLLAQRIPNDVTVDPTVLHRAADILEQFGSSEAWVSTLPMTGSGADPAGPIALAAVGHSVIETLSTRLRGRTAGEWSTLELKLLAPVLAEHTRQALAIYSTNGNFQFAVLADGTGTTPELLPANALRLQKSGDGYIQLNADLRVTRHTYRSVFAALEESSRAPRNAHELDDTRLERDFRSMLADSIDARSTRPELERMHRQWIDPMRLPDRQKRLVKDLSLLRHVLVDRHESLTAAQIRRLAEADVEVGDASSAGSVDSHWIDNGVLARLAEEDSALLPAGLDFLLVKDVLVRAHALTQDADEWILDNRHYVRLRHIDGRTQIVETRPGGTAAPREILAPGSDADRATTRWLVNVEGMWYPETWLREGFAPIDPTVHAAVIETISEKLPPSVPQDHEAIARIVDSIPPPLLGFFKTSLMAVDVETDGALALKVRDPESGRSKRYFTHVDGDGSPITRAQPMLLEPLGELAGDRQLILPVRRKQEGVAPTSVSHHALGSYVDLLHAERPISEFIALGVGDRHVSVLTATRRLRGMLREDSNMALVGATPDHALTLLLPANAETFRLVGPERDAGRLVNRFPPGTIIVDNLYEVTAAAEEYPGLVREIALEWEASGNTIKRVRPDGTDEAESPVAYTERLLSTPLRVNLWNPKHDPISEERYVRYLHRLFSAHGAVRHAGLDWLTNQQARRDYMGYFAPPSNVLPFSDVHVVPGRHASTMRELADAALNVGLETLSDPTVMAAGPGS